jgi:hypothetical protein
MELKSSILRGIASVYHRVGRSSPDDDDDDDDDDACWMVILLCIADNQWWGGVQYSICGDMTP